MSEGCCSLVSYKYWTLMELHALWFLVGNHFQGCRQLTSFKILLRLRLRPPFIELCILAWLFPFVLPMPYAQWCPLGVCLSIKLLHKKPYLRVHLREHQLTYIIFVRVTPKSWWQSVPWVAAGSLTQHSQFCSPTSGWWICIYLQFCKCNPESMEEWLCTS